MTKKKQPPAPQDEALLDVDLQPVGSKRKVGRVERRVYESARKLAAAGALRDVDAALVGAELALAEVLDTAARTKKPGWEYAVAANARELLKVHQALAGSSDAGKDDEGELRELLGDLTRPS